MKSIYLVFILIINLYAQDVVYDKKSNLTWQDNKDTINKVYKLESGIFDIGAIEYCAKLDLNDFSDWRLPTIREYINIIDVSKNNPATRLDFKYVVLRGNKIANDGYMKYSYWTSSIVSKIYKDDKDLKSVYLVNLIDGMFGSSYILKDQFHFVRCVRNGID